VTLQPPVGVPDDVVELFGVGVGTTVSATVADGVAAGVFAVGGTEDEAVLSEPQAESNAISSKRPLTNGINKILFIISFTSQNL
jgi:hypothetical protein